MKSLFLAFSVVLLACGGSSMPCPDDTPATCPDPAPSYKSEIAPIIEQNCSSCHCEFSTQAGLAMAASSVSDLVSGCSMPPPPRSLGDNDRVLLLGWLVCGAPDN